MGVDSIPERDKEAVLNDPHSKIARKPDTPKIRAYLHIFHNTPFTYGQNGINGLHYAALQDAIKWAGLSRKATTPILLSMCNHYLKGINSKTR